MNFPDDIPAGGAEDSLTEPIESFTPPPPEPPLPPDPGGGRILSIDALRGFDMFWIVGGTGS